MTTGTIWLFRFDEEKVDVVGTFRTVLLPISEPRLDSSSETSFLSQKPFAANDRI